jgi:uncharacterized protein
MTKPNPQPAVRPVPATDPPPRPLRVAAVADLHVHQVHHGEHRALFTQVSEHADIVCLCGDLTNLGLPEEAEHLAADLSALRIPAVAVLGNHDCHSGKTADVKRILRKANVTFIDDEPLLFRGVGFAGAKGFGGGFGHHMLGPFGEDATKHFVTEAVNESLTLENALHRFAPNPTVVVLHYSPVVETVKGESPEIFPFLGCSRLAETIDRFEGVAAVFHGHAHRGQHLGRTPRGVPVYNCSLEVMQAAHGKPYTLIEVQGRMGDHPVQAPRRTTPGRTIQRPAASNDDRGGAVDASPLTVELPE